MQIRVVATAGLAVLILAAVLFALFGFGGSPNVTLPTGNGAASTKSDASVAKGDLVAEVAVADGTQGNADREQVGAGRAPTGVRGIVGRDILYA